MSARKVVTYLAFWGSLVLTLLATKPAPAAGVAVQALEWRRYEDTWSGVSLKYPSSLVLERWEPLYPIIASFSLIDGQAVSSSVLRSEISISLYANPAELTAREWLDRESFQTSDSGGAAYALERLYWNPKKLNRLDVAGRSALSFSHDSFDVQAVTILVPDGDLMLSISYALVAPTQTEINQLIWPILETVAWTRPASDALLSALPQLPNQKTELEPQSHNSSPTSPTDDGYRLPWTQGETYRVAQSWGGSTHQCGGQQCYAYDFDNGSTSFEGVTIRSSKEGDVSYIKSDVAPDYCGGYDYRDSANYVTVKHPDGQATLYLHLSSVQVGYQSIERGAVVGVAGKTGWTQCYAHLHFQRQAQGNWITQSVPIYFDEASGQQLQYQQWITSSNGGDNTVKLYRENDYTNQYFSKGPGSYNDPSPVTNSMSVPAGWIVWTYKAENKGGESRCWNSSIPKFQDHGWQDFESIEILNSGSCPEGPAVKLYRENNYTNQYFSKGPGSYNDPSGTTNSMRVPDGWIVWTYREENKGGEKRCWDSDIPKFQDHGWQNFESIEVVNGGACPPSANFDAWPNSGFPGPAPLQVAFHDTSQGEYSTCLWEYGDGNTSNTCGGNGSYHNYTYTSPGTYSPSLTITGPGGTNKKTISNYIVVLSNTPGIPTHISPVDNAVFNRNDNITLTWTTASNASQYMAQIIAEPDFVRESGLVSGTSWNVGQLSGGLYAWRIRAVSSTGYSSDWSSTRLFTVKYDKPKNLIATPISSSRIDLSWDPSADAPSNIDGYRVLRNGSPIATVSSATTTYANTGLSCDTSYTYVVRAYKGAMESDASNSAGATTTNCSLPDAPIPQHPADGAVLNREANISLSWSEPPNASKYYAEVWGGPNGDQNSGWVTPTSWNLGQMSGGTYSWRVKARDGSGTNSPWSATRTFTVKYGAPSNLHVVIVSSSQLNVYWDASADGPNNIGGYRIYRDGVPIATVNKNTIGYYDSGLTCGTSYSYVVKAYKGSVESDASGSANGATVDCELSPPTIEPISNSDGDGDYVVSWNATGPLESGYVLEEKHDSGAWEEILRAPEYSMARSDMPSGVWCYRVKVFTDTSTSPWSAVNCTTVDSITEPPETPSLSPIGNPTQTNSYWVSWASVTGATEYEMQERHNGGAWAGVYSGSSEYYYAVNRANGTWCYRVRARNWASTSDWSNTVCTIVQASTYSYQVYIVSIMK